MNNDYFNYEKSLYDLTSVLSVGYYFKYSYEVIEKRISNSKYFKNFNKTYFDSESYISTEDLLKQIYFDLEINEYAKNLFYNELEWVATFYINVINETLFSFETIFCYAPIEEVLVIYKLYHELDIRKAIEWFNEKKEKASLIKIKMKELKLSNIELSKITGISSSTIDALKNRRRDIKKLNVQHAVNLSKALNIEIETLLNN